MCEWAEDDHAKESGFKRQFGKRTLEGNILQGPGLYVSGSKTEVGLVLEIILYL